MSSSSSPSQNLQHPKSISELLNDEFLRRCRKNKSYTLSAFARSLKVDTSTLSKIMKGLRTPGKRAVVALATKLKLDAETIARLADPKKAAQTQASYQQISLDHFHIIADWYHYAILELMVLRDFEPDLAWIAKALKISSTEAREAVERLTRVGILEIKPDGRWVDHSGGYSTTTGSEFTAAAFRQLQHQVLGQAIVALENVPFEKRSQTSMTMAIDPARLPEARELIKQFRRRLNRLVGGSGRKRSEVYQLSVSLFPVTQIKGDKK